MSHYAKAVAAFATVFSAGIIAAVTEASPAGSSVVGYEWAVIVAQSVAAAAAVFAVPNK